MLLPPALKLVTIVLVSMLAGMMNSIAGGGTLLTFPALIGLGISPIVANATSTVALWPGAVSSLFGYREELVGARPWAIGFAAPSVLGGGIGAWLLLRTPPARFAAIVPWLVLSATVLFILQPLVMRRIRQRRRATGAAVDDRNDDARTSSAPIVEVLAVQLAIAIYGGYFGAGMGILMLAVLGFAGLTNIHRMNGLKNWGGLCANAVAAVIFATSGLVNWAVALSMAVGSIAGGYLGSRTAQRVPQHFVRMIVIAIGVGSGIWLLF
jgi:uncharacterized protein